MCLTLTNVSSMLVLRPVTYDSQTLLAGVPSCLCAGFSTVRLTEKINCYMLLCRPAGVSTTGMMTHHQVNKPLSRSPLQRWQLCQHPSCKLQVASRFFVVQCDAQAEQGALCPFWPCIAQLSRELRHFRVSESISSMCRPCSPLAGSCLILLKSVVQGTVLFKCLLVLKHKCPLPCFLHLCIPNLLLSSHPHKDQAVPVLRHCQTVGAASDIRMITVVKRRGCMTVHGYLASPSHTCVSACSCC